jgi:MFS family permease
VTAPLPFRQALRSFRGAFWAGNVMEMLERLAYYGVRVVVPIYIASTQDPNGLHFTNAEKGEILALWALVQTLVPMFSGGFADRYGRKRTIALSIALKVSGYLLMATQRSYGGFLFGCLVLAAGTAVFKPGLWGTLAVGIDERASSLGWGIFYWIVNVGGFLGPPLAGFLHGYGWKWVFFSCAAIVSLNFVMLLTYEDATPPRKESALGVAFDSIGKLVRDPRALAFVGIASAYCCMFMQLFDALPNFIEEWTDSSDLVAALNLHEGQLARMTPRGLQVPQEWMINLDAGMILLLMVPVSALAGKLRLLFVVVGGIACSCLGLFLAGGSMSGFACIAGIFVFAIGEMLAAPKLNEYLALIAPKGDEALYMGYANIPWAVGWTSGAYVAGRIYEKMADKANLAARWLAEHGQPGVARDEAFKAMQAKIGVGATEATKILWDAYHPYAFWYGFVALGGASAALMYLFARSTWRTKK